MVKDKALARLPGEYNSKLALPKGLRVFFGSDAARKRSLEELLISTYEAWGYHEVSTPCFEYAESLSVSLAAQKTERLYKFVERTGKLLALRNDHTTPIARMVAANMRDLPLPLRVCYDGNVFRRIENGSGERHQWQQSGIECFGRSGPQADAEVISIAIAALLKAGFCDFQVNIGDVSFFHGILAAAAIPELAVRPLHSALLRKGSEEIKSVLAEYKVSERWAGIIEQLPDMYGGPEVLTAAKLLVGPGKASAALDNLVQIQATLAAAGYAEYLVFDLGEVKEFEYYTGTIFEIFAPGIPDSICDGGRYNQLLSQFGYDCPATGFAFKVDRLVAYSRLRDQQLHLRPTDYLVVGPDCLAVNLVATALRGVGRNVATVHGDLAAAKSYASTYQAEAIVEIGEGSGPQQELLLHTLATGAAAAKLSLSLDQLLAR